MLPLTLHITGMSCGHCLNAVNQALAALPGLAVESVRILRGLNPLLDNAAMRAVSQWKYKPATFNGRAVPVYLTVTVTFKLQ